MAAELRVTDGPDSALSQTVKDKIQDRLVAEIKSGCLLKKGSSSVLKAPCDCHWVTFSRLSSLLTQTSK